MCEHGSRTQLEVMVDASVAYEGVSLRKSMPIDTCLVPLVKALDGAGIYMLGSCCGHGTRLGEILLADGRALYIQDLPIRSES